MKQNNEGNYLGKKDLINVIAENIDNELTKNDIAKVLDGFQKACVKFINSGQNLKLVSWITITVKDVPARDVRNPKTGKITKAEATRKMSAKMSKSILQSKDKTKK